MSVEAAYQIPEAALSTFQILHDHGYHAYLVGGCVRDHILGLPIKDFDVTTNATPEEVLRIFPGSNMVGAQFGVVIVAPDIEVATFRSDDIYVDGRRPAGVTYELSPLKDVQRRDFTINALLLNPASGEISDFVNGRTDLDNRVIRAIGDPCARFREDHLRLLRAIRFAARLNFTIEPVTLAAIQDLAHLVLHVSPERVRYEISRVLVEGHARRGFELLDETGLLAHVLPEIAAMKGVRQPPEFHPEGDVWVHTMIMLEGLPPSPPLALALGVLLHDVGKPSTFQVADRIRFNGHVEAGVAISHQLLSRLRYSNDLIAEVEALVANHMRFGDLQKMRESTLKRFLRLPSFEQHLELHRLDCSSSHGHLDNYDLARAKLAEKPAEMLRPAPLLSGEDLINAGYYPGPIFRRILTAVEDEQLESHIHTKDEALLFVKHHFQVLP